MIVKDTIKKALYYKVIEIIDDSHFNTYTDAYGSHRNTSGICCKIGNHAFYFGTGEDFYKINELNTVDKYWQTYSLDKTAEMLLDVLETRFNAVEKYGLDNNEYDYYVSALQKCDRENESTIDYYATCYMELLKDGYRGFANQSDTNTKPYLETLLPDIYAIKTVDEWNNSAKVREFQDIINEHKCSVAEFIERGFYLDDYVGYWCLKYNDNLEVGLRKLSGIMQDLHGVDWQENYKILSRLEDLYAREVKCPIISKANTEREWERE